MLDSSNTHKNMNTHTMYIVHVSFQKALELYQANLVKLNVWFVLSIDKIQIPMVRLKLMRCHRSILKWDMH